MKLTMAAAAAAAAAVVVVVVVKGGRVSDGRVITKLPGNIVVVLVRWESSYFTRECLQKPNGIEGPTNLFIPLTRSMFGCRKSTLGTWFSPVPIGILFLKPVKHRRWDAMWV